MIQHMMALTSQTRDTDVSEMMTEKQKNIDN